VVLEAAVKLLTNPIFLKMVLVFFACGFAFLMAAFMMRRVRKSLGSSQPVTQTSDSEQFPLHTYHAVIQQLKQQKHELSALRDAEQRRAKTSENISAAVLSNLSSGVVFFGPNGLVRQANQAAKNILGIASPGGMDAEAMFHSATLSRPSAGAPSVTVGVQTALKEGTPVRRVEAEYLTPGGERRVIEEISDIRRQLDLRGELSAEMALALRNSLITISGYAQQLASNHDPELAAQIAADIAAEAKHLDHTIGGFLAESKKAKAVSTAQS
jgi:nitrogen fixation/metabolism regulation signal transduction histidine kinase